MKITAFLKTHLAPSVRRSPLLAVFLPALFPLSSQAVVSQPESFSGMYDSTTYAQFDGVAVYGSTNSGNFSSLTLPVFPSVAANTPTTLGPTTVQVPVGATNLRVAVFSVYGSATSSTVSMTLDNTVAANFYAGSGTAFSTDFSSISEATLAGYIQGAAAGNNSAAAALESFFNTYSSDFSQVNTATNTASGTVVTFSNAAFGGTASLSLAPVPEPSTYALLGSGATVLGLALRRRRMAA